MKIESSSILFDSIHQINKSVVKTEKLKFWTGKNPNLQSERNDKNDINVDLLNKISKNEKPKESSDLKSIFKLGEDPKLALVRIMFEQIFGVSLDLFDEEDIEAIRKSTEVSINLSQKYSEINDPQKNQNWGLEYDSKTIISESEYTSFSSEGTIKTKDGQEINFTIKMNLSRKFVEEHNLSLRFGNAVQKDPLVINFDGNSAELTQEKYAFDLDSDGKNESMSFAMNNSGFLAIDKNSDGKINNGSELFGAITGDGFQELSAYDDDKNTWIDENDSNFDKLLVYNKNQDGTDNLSSLKSKNIGAIYLKNSEAQFEYKTNINDKLAESKTAGLYLKENGSIGTLQQIDLVV